VNRAINCTATLCTQRESPLATHHQYCITSSWPKILV